MILFCGLTFPSGFFFFFFNDTATTEIYTLSLHDALPICFGDRSLRSAASLRAQPVGTDHSARGGDARSGGRSEEHTSNSSHSQISYAVFCLKKKKRP